MYGTKRFSSTNAFANLQDASHYRTCERAKSQTLNQSRAKK